MNRKSSIAVLAKVVQNALPIALLLVVVGCSSSKSVVETPQVTDVEIDQRGPESQGPTGSPTEPANPESDEGSAEEPGASGFSNWHLLAAGPTSTGTGVVEAYQLLAEEAPQREVVVAVIDSGVDINHEDLDDNVWVNPGEIAGNGVDDDSNGYVDDVHGWNFIGGPDGKNVEYDTFEVVRELVRLKPEFGEAVESEVPADRLADYKYYLRLTDAYAEERSKMEGIATNIEAAVKALTFANTVIGEELGKSSFSIEDVVSVQSEKPEVKQAQGILVYLDQLGLTESDLASELESAQSRIKYGLDLDYDPRYLIGDNYEDVREQYYGNPDVIGTDASHGTHVAGIIAAERMNELGIDGIAPTTQIMVIRAVPNGDERDKDVANAIRYAVDNGAHIINMSFGKSFSSHPEVVAEAVAYASENNVLLVHAAGNDGRNNDEELHFPNRAERAGFPQPSNWIEVGASGPDLDGLAAPFSNYGKNGVDLFAPGVQIVSTVPGNEYEPGDGTSMAAPVVSGVAALIMAYFPDLSASDVKSAIMSSVESYGGQSIVKPGSEESVVFDALSITGGVVSARNAVQGLLSQ